MAILVIYYKNNGNNLYLCDLCLIFKVGYNLKFDFMKRIICLFLVIAFLFGCSPKSDSIENSGAANTTSSTVGVNEDVRQLVKESNISFRTSNNEKTYSKIKSSLKDFGAYVSEENIQNDINRIGYDLTLKVPVQNFDAFINHIISNSDIKELENKSIQIKDVTDDFIDIQARIKVKKEYELQLLDLLRKSKTLKETLEVRNQLNDLRIEIEKLEGKLKYLNSQVNYSTINVSFYQKTKYSSQFFSDFWESLKSGWQIFLHLISLIAYLWVIILVFFLGRWGYKYYNKRKKK